MNASELRIGNRVDKGVIKSFYESGIHIGGGKCFGFSELNPVPLTMDILLDYGFIEKGTLFKKNHKANIEFDVYYSLSEKHLYCFIFNRKVILDYVHQLQNLYFSINNQEL